MSFKEEIEDMCAKAKRDHVEIMVQLPDPPEGWDADRLLERLFQLAHLIKRNGCTLERVDGKVFKIIAEKE